MRSIAFSRLLLIMAAVPLIAMTVFAGMLTYQSWSRYGDLARASSLLRLAGAGGRFATAMPGEGLATREAIGGHLDQAKLDAARRNTDEMYRGVHAAAAANLVKDPRLDNLLKAL